MQETTIKKSDSMRVFNLANPSDKNHIVYDSTISILTIYPEYLESENKWYAETTEENEDTGLKNKEQRLYHLRKAIPKRQIISVEFNISHFFDDPYWGLNIGVSTSYIPFFFKKRSECMEAYEFIKEWLGMV
jgi:hypothetical protein